MKESEYVTQIIAELEKIGAKAVKFVETEYSEIGTPDIIGCYKGRTFVVEAKVEPNYLSTVQKFRLEEWEKAGALCYTPTYPSCTVKYLVQLIKSDCK